ncbi:unnamed protein product, partial [Coccothraustes coccothraustes]
MKIEGSGCSDHLIAQLPEGFLRYRMNMYYSSDSSEGGELHQELCLGVSQPSA